MKLLKVSAVLGLATTAIVGGVIGGSAGCSNNNNGADSGIVGQPLPPPSNPTPASTKVETFAVKTLLLGEAPRSGGAPSNTAWKDYGYNLDGLVTGKDDTNVCTLAAGAPKTNQVDGTNGIDNAFGSVILPIIQSAASLPTPSTTISTAIDNGDFTILIQVTGLDDTATQNSINLTGQLFAAGAYTSAGATGTPTFDSTTDWPVLPELLTSTSQPFQSQVQFNQAYIADGTFVSGNLATGGVTVSISLVFQGVPLTLSVNHAVITFNHSSPTAAAGGIIAGVIDTTDLINGLKSVAGRISTSLCGSAFDGIAQQIQQASDIIHDGSNKAGVPCDGISIGLGFEGVLVANPDKLDENDSGVSPDPCATDGGTTTDSSTTDSSSTDATGQ